MDATQIQDIESMKVWAIQHEGKVINAMENQTRTNVETSRVLRELQNDSKASDRRMQRWMGMGVVLVPILVSVMNWVMKKL